MIKNYKYLKDELVKLGEKNKKDLLLFLISLYYNLEKIDFLVEDINDLYFLIERSIKGNENYSWSNSLLYNGENNNLILFEVFKNKDFDKKYNYLLRETLLIQINELFNNDYKSWNNISLNNYMEAGISGLIAHYGENETLMNSVIFAGILQLSKLYE